MEANRKKPRGAAVWLALNWSGSLCWMVLWLTSIYLYSLVVNYSITAMAKGQSRSAAGALVGTRRLLLSVTGSLELSLIKYQLIYGFKAAGCALSSQRRATAVRFWSINKMKPGGNTLVSGERKWLGLFCDHKGSIRARRLCVWVEWLVMPDEAQLSPRSG